MARKIYDALNIKSHIALNIRRHRPIELYPPMNLIKRIIGEQSSQQLYAGERFLSTQFYEKIEIETPGRVNNYALL